MSGESTVEPTEEGQTNWRDRLRKIGKSAFIQEEMQRLGFWKPDTEAAQKSAEALAALKIRYDELAVLQAELNAVQTELSTAQDVAALLLDIRKRRIERVRAARLEKKEARVRLAEEKRANDKEWRRRTLPYLGAGVSAGLRYEGGEPEKVAELSLPALATASDLAQAIGISEQSLAWLTYHRTASSVDHYNRFTIPKKRGGVRVISSPKTRLRVAQRWLLDSLLTPLPVHDAAVAFRPGVSIKDNADRHAGKPLVLRFDLQDFFPSISIRRVKGLFQSFGYNEGIATLLALLATECPRVATTFDGQKRFVSLGERQLPQGACTSPALSNLLCRTLDRRLTGATSAFGFAYSRYADDLVFSHADPKTAIGAFLALVRQIITDEGFTLNDAKTAVMRPHDRQTVTGLVVNGDGPPRVSRRDLRRFRAFLHGCRTQGLPAMTQRLGRDAAAYAAGYLSFLHMVNPDQEQSLRQAHPWLDAAPSP